MAKTPAPAEKPSADTEEFKDRLADARRQKEDVDLDLREAYFFTNPRLARQVTSRTPVSTKVETDQDELSTDLGTELSVDFATEIINGFFSPHMNWVTSAPSIELEERMWKDIEGAVRDRDDAIFRGIRASGFDAALATALVPDISLGTVALMIDDPHPALPVSCLHVPIRELEVNVGRDGSVDDRFAVRWMKRRHAASLLRDIKLPPKVRRRLKDKPDKMCSVTWAWWRKWEEMPETVWYHCIAVDDEVVAVEEKRGEGSCALVVMRFMPHALNAWGNGPAIQALPKLRVLDKATEATHDRFDQAISPSFGFPDDGVMNFENGLQSGYGYPMRPGSGRDIVPLYFQGDSNLAFYTLQDMERSPRRSFYADYPQQRGDTPPTATQWIDEMVLSQRRIGTPGVAFWREGPAEVFKRYAWIYAERGIVKPVELNGTEVALRPENPATKAQEQLEVQLGVRLLEILKNLLPETSAAAIDELATAKNLKEKMGDKLIELRSEEEAQRLVQSMLAAAPQAGGA